MNGLVLFLAVALGPSAGPLAPGDHHRSVQAVAGGPARPYLLHVPPSYDPNRPTPVVLALHPFATNGTMMARISGLNATADREGFLVAYPDGTGRATFLHWNVGAMAGDQADDVGYLTQVLDDLVELARVDPKRVYATGFSNGGMMCYRLASELSGRIAAIAPVAGTMIGDPIRATRPVPVLHVHGTDDQFVSYDGRLWRDPRAARLKGAEATALAWARFNGCPEVPESITLTGPGPSVDGLVIKRMTYGPGRAGAEVILYRIEGGGHTWPGGVSNGAFLGKTAADLKANDLIWDFFRKHPMP